MFTFGAVFVEVRVDMDLGIPRVTRCVGAYSAGRIITGVRVRDLPIVPERVLPSGV